jgi:hypothetical protein
MMPANTKAVVSYPQRLSAATAARSWTNPLSPSTVDNWLNIATRKPGVAHLQEGYVMCLVEKVSVQVRLPSMPSTPSNV